jgi:Rieske Fe-S protein
MADEITPPLEDEVEGKLFTRRMFLTSLLSISALLTVIPFSPMLSFFFTLKKEEATQEKTIANIKDVPVGSTMIFFYPQEEGKDRSFLTHLTPEQLEKARAEGRDEFVVDGFVALNSICTHLQCPAELPVGDEIICVCHGAYFDTIDGTVLAGPAPRPFPMVRLRIEPDTGDIYATGLVGKIGYGRDV